MSHEIEKPIDRVFSTVGTEWHGLAEQVELIDNDIVRYLSPKIISQPLSLDMGAATGDEATLRKALMSAVNKKKDADGNLLTLDAYLSAIKGIVSNIVPVPAYKMLVADYREVRPDLINEPCGALIPLHVPKTSYGEIENGELWEVCKNSLKDVDAKVTCAGTLKAGKVFFISCQLGDGGKFDVTLPDGRKDSFLANLNFITSHDGTLGVKAYDSTVRIVCMNTLRWSLDSAGEVGFTVYHTQNRRPAMQNLGDLVNSVLSGRATFRDSMSYLASESISAADAKKLIAGYFVLRARSMGVTEDESGKFATRTKNAIAAIGDLFARGLGNAGKSLYDVLNAFTEYYTNGDGTGKDGDKMSKLCKANFGSAADHKTVACNLLMSGADNRASVVELGAKAINENGL